MTLMDEKKATFQSTVFTLILWKILIVKESIKVEDGIIMINGLKFSSFSFIGMW